MSDIVRRYMEIRLFPSFMPETLGLMSDNFRGVLSKSYCLPGNFPDIISYESKEIFLLDLHLGLEISDNSMKIITQNCTNINHFNVIENGINVTTWYGCYYSLIEKNGKQQTIIDNFNICIDSTDKIYFIEHRMSISDGNIIDVNINTVHFPAKGWTIKSAKSAI